MQVGGQGVLVEGDTATRESDGAASGLGVGVATELLEDAVEFVPGLIEAVQGEADEAVGDAAVDIVGARAGSPMRGGQGVGGASGEEEGAGCEEVHHGTAVGVDLTGVGEARQGLVGVLGDFWIVGWGISGWGITGWRCAGCGSALRALRHGDVAVDVREDAGRAAPALPSFQESCHGGLRTSVAGRVFGVEAGKERMFGLC